MVPLQVPQLHPPEEHKGYADGDTVHFHREIPNSAVLEFRRDDGSVQIPQILSKQELIKKIEERKKLREKEANENGNFLNISYFEKVTVIMQFSVVDYQQNKKPDKVEQDYKEMGELFFPLR